MQIKLMKQKLFFTIFFTSILLFSLQAKVSYRYFVDLKNVNNDKLSVKLLPEINLDVVEFCFPAMIPGTYAIYNFGRFVSELKIIAKDGSLMNSIKLDVNRYQIVNAKNIYSISYSVEDSWDTKDTSNIVFEPAGTSFDLERNFIINTHGIFGYFDGMTKDSIEVEITKPVGFYGSTGLSGVEFGVAKDLFHVLDYHELVDSPIMYNLPDTATIDVGGAKVLISVFSPNKKITSPFVVRTIESILKAQQNYLGGTLPVNKYAFLFYFNDVPTMSRSSGALEHSYSSMYVLPEMDSISLEQTIKDVAAHEFFHIVTPLNIHSYEVGDFNFSKPQMSMHLWMYEGMTEYAAHHVQVKEALISVDEYLQNIQEKMLESQDNFNDTLAFTLLSKLCLDKYKSQYNNVYAKGALIGMCLDILLREESQGRYGTQSLMKDLSKKYGKNNSFVDKDLFTEIEKLTSKEIRFFLDTYVAGNKKLPYEQIFRKCGILYSYKKIENEISLGGIEIGYNPVTSRLLVLSTVDQNLFGKKMGYKENDELVSFNGTKLNISNVKDIIIGFLTTAKEGDKCEVEVSRKNKMGKEKVKKLKAKVIRCSTVYRNDLKIDTNATDKEINTFKSWLGLSDE